jgi:hypothetical protein
MTRSNKKGINKHEVADYRIKHHKNNIPAIHAL